MIEIRYCKHCGRELASDNPKDYCLDCRGKGYGESQDVYCPEDRKLGIGPEQTRRYFRKCDKEGYQVLPADWRKRGIRISKGKGKKGHWSFTFGATEEEVEAAITTLELLNEIGNFMPRGEFHMILEEELKTHGLDWPLEFIARLGSKEASWIEHWRSIVAVASGLPENRRLTFGELKQSMVKYLEQNPELVEKMNNVRTMITMIRAYQQFSRLNG